MFCPKCGTSFEGTECPECGEKLPINQFLETEKPIVEETKPKKKKHGKNKVVLAIIAVILTIAIVISSIAIAIVNKPTVKLALAVEKLLFNTESFDFEYVNKYSTEITYKDEGRTNKYDGKVRVRGSIAFGGDIFSSSFQVRASDDDETFLRAVSNGGDALVVIYPSDYDYPAFQGNLPQIYQYIKDNREEIVDTVTGGSYSYEEIEDLVEENAFVSIDQIIEWIDAAVSKNKVNEDTFEDMYNTWARKLIGEYVDGVDEDELPDYKTIKKVLTKFITSGITDEAVEIKDKRREDGVQYYDVVIHGKEFVKCLYEFIKDNKDLEEFFDSDFGSNLLDDIKEAVDEIKSNDNLEITFGISKGRLSYIKFVDSYKENDDYWKYISKDETEIIFSNFNKKVDYQQEYADVKKIRDDEDWIEVSEIEDIYY